MRFDSARALLLVMASACVTPPPPLPPRRAMFMHPPVAPEQRAPDIAVPAEAPIVHERYGGFTLAADIVSVVPLTIWLFRPNDVYLALPALLLTPLIHIAHGESDKAGISLVMRAAMVAGVYFAGRAARRECQSDELICYPIGSITLAELAIIPVMTIDGVFLARRTRKADGWHRLPLQPSIGMGSDGRRLLSLGTRF